jgi:hypothetical protein
MMASRQLWPQAAILATSSFRNNGDDQQARGGEQLLGSLSAVVGVTIAS